jgi:membrane protein
MASANPDVASLRGSPWRTAWSGRKDVLARLKVEIKQDRISLIAAGAAFFAFLSIFPSMVALISLYGVFTDPARVETQLAPYMNAIPAPAGELLTQQMRRIAEGAPDTLGWSAVIGIVVALWSANKGMKAMISALGVAYGQREQRKFFRLNALSLTLTGAAVLFVLVALALSAVIPIALHVLGLEGATATIIAVLRWPLLALFVVVAISSLYRWAPRRPSPHWRWLTPGAVVATGVFLLASAAMSVYISRFGDHGEVYGSVTAVAVLMLWLFLIALAVLLGAELNAAIERREVERRAE